jgi:hypothetical protein
MEQSEYLYYLYEQFGGSESYEEFLDSIRGQQL